MTDDTRSLEPSRSTLSDTLRALASGQLPPRRDAKPDGDEAEQAWNRIRQREAAYALKEFIQLAPQYGLHPRRLLLEVPVRKNLLSREYVIRRHPSRYSGWLITSKLLIDSQEGTLLYPIFANRSNVRYLQDYGTRTRRSLPHSLQILDELGRMPVETSLEEILARFLVSGGVAPDVNLDARAVDGPILD